MPLLKLTVAVIAVFMVTVASQSQAQLLTGGFIQLDDGLKESDTAAWGAILDKMCAAKCNIVILQYLEVRESAGPPTNEEYVPSNDRDFDATAIILKYAEDHPGMKVFIGLRFDKLLLNAQDLNNSGELKARLQDELPRNIELARKVADRYNLKTRDCFGGWYLPTEVLNYKETAAPGGADGWVNQLSQFTQSLVKECRNLAEKPVAVSPGFNADKDMDNHIPDYLVSPEQMGADYARFLSGTGISIVMLQDSVGAHNVKTVDVDGYVIPFLKAINGACQKESFRSHRNVELWLNIESFTASSPDPPDINRLEAQLRVGQGIAAKFVTFEFPHHLAKSPLYEQYLILSKGS